MNRSTLAVVAALGGFSRIRRARLRNPGWGWKTAACAKNRRLIPHGIQMSSRTAEARTAHLPITSAAAAVHPGWVRTTHWINVVAMFVMITSGWCI